MGVCNCSMFCCTLLYVHFSIAIILMGKRELIALLNLSSWCLVMVERLFLTVPRGCLQFVIVVYPDHTHLLFTMCIQDIWGNMNAYSAPVICIQRSESGNSGAFNFSIFKVSKGWLKCQLKPAPYTIISRSAPDQEHANWPPKPPCCTPFRFMLAYIGRCFWCAVKRTFQRQNISVMAY